MIYLLTAEQKRLVEDNQLLVRFTIKKYFRGGKNYPIEYEDMEQIGYLALCRAARRFDPTRGKFSTFAILAIRGQIHRCLRDLNMPKRRGNLFTVSLYQEYVAGKDGSTTLADVLPDPGMSVEDCVSIRQITKYISNESNKDQRSAVLIACLTGQITQQEAAQKIGISQPQVSRLLKAYKQCVREAVGE